jgi:ABC-2 type transport system ATP-binding protein
LNSILGISHLDAGTINVLGIDPRQHRKALMQRTAYIADVGILPRWMKIAHLLDFVEGVNPSFDRQTALNTLAKTEIKLDKKVHTLSKGMNVQLHLAIVLAINAEFLVLDEPTLGLDILYRQQFYDSVLNDYFQEQRSILITTHEVREIEHILTDVVFIHRGRAILNLSMDQLGAEFAKVTAGAGELEALRGLQPLSERKSLQGTECIFRGADRDALAQYADVVTPNLAELFVAVVGDKS